ncbi:hypothetical protein LguiB_021891 [Lonicera macranthoides]
MRSITSTTSFTFLRSFESCEAFWHPMNLGLGLSFHAHGLEDKNRTGPSPNFKNIEIIVCCDESDWDGHLWSRRSWRAHAKEGRGTAITIPSLSSVPNGNIPQNGIMMVDTNRGVSQCLPLLPRQQDGDWAGNGYLLYHPTMREISGFEEGYID